MNDPITHSQQPIVTGTSVLALRFKDGIIMAADTLASYGSLARFRDERRLLKVGYGPGKCLIGASGDMGDFQFMKESLEQLLIDDEITDDGHSLNSSSIYQYLSNLMYSRRSNMNPLWNTYVVAGYGKDNEPVLGCADLQGTTWQSDSLATGFGSYMAQPLLRKHLENSGGSENISYEQARLIMEECMRVMFYRDARSLNRIQIGTIWKERNVMGRHGVEITEPFSLSTEWSFAEFIRGYGRA